MSSLYRHLSVDRAQTGIKKLLAELCCMCTACGLVEPRVLPSRHLEISPWIGCPSKQSDVMTFWRSDLEALLRHPSEPPSG